MRRIPDKDLLSSDTILQLNSIGLSEVPELIGELESSSGWHKLTFTEKLAQLINLLYQEKQSAAIKRLKKAARLRYPNASLSSIDYREDRKLDRKKMVEIGSLAFLRWNINIVIEGPTGSGKTYIACALGVAGCEKLYKTMYVRFPELLQAYDELYDNPGAKRRFIKKFAGYPILIIDEWLMKEISAIHQDMIFEIIEMRHTAHSTIFCTQYPMENWLERLGENTRGEAILDRIIHNSQKIHAGSINMRRLEGEKKKEAAKV